MGIRELLRRTCHEFNDDDVLTYSAALAYHALLALFPFMLFLLALVTFFDIPIVFDRLMQWSRTILPPQGVEVVSDVVRSFQRGENTGLLSIGIIGAIWAASGGVRSAINALNSAYDVEELRPAWRRYLVSIAFTVGMGTMLLAAMVLLLIGPRAMEWLTSWVGLGNVFVDIWMWARFPVAVAILIVVSAVIYSVLPNVRGFRLLTVGSMVAVPLWVALSFGFRLYLSHFGNYDVLYGSVGAVIVLLLYLWLSAMVLLLGGELNAVLSAEQRESARTGESRELGRLPRA